MDPLIQLIKTYFTGGGVRGKVLNSGRIVLDDVVLGEFDPASREVKIRPQSPDGDYSKALMAYTLYQAIGISVYRRLGGPAKARLVQVLGTVDEESIMGIFANAYADYAVYKEEFGLVTNQE